MFRTLRVGGCHGACSSCNGSAHSRAKCLQLDVEDPLAFVGDHEREFHTERGLRLVEPFAEVARLVVVPQLMHERQMRSNSEGPIRAPDPVMNTMTRASCNFTLLCRLDVYRAPNVPGRVSSSATGIGQIGLGGTLA